MPIMGRRPQPVFPGEVPEESPRIAAEFFVECLENEGVEFVFGIPGEETLDLNEALDRSTRLTFIPVRHEQVAASIVDATARLTRRPGCILLHSGAGTLAASLGIAAAARESTPMIVLTGTQERQAALRGYSQTMDVLAPLQALTKWQ